MLATLKQLISQHTKEEVTATNFFHDLHQDFVIAEMSAAIYSTLKYQLTKWNISGLVNLFGEVHINEKHVLVKEIKARFLARIRNLGFNIKEFGEASNNLFPIILEKVVKDVALNDNCKLEIKDVLIELANNGGNFDLNYLEGNFHQKDLGLVWGYM